MESSTARVRPVAVPDDLSDLDGPPLRRVMELPRHVRWSGPPIEYDLSIRSHRISVYEQVLCEGTADDVRRFVRLSDLVDLWDELYLPDYVRQAWNRPLAERPAVGLRADLPATAHRVHRRRSGEADSFALAGGAGLIVHRVVDRETHDLDYFATTEAAVVRLAPVLEDALRDAGLQVRRLQDSAGFVRLEVSSAEDVCEVDLAFDARLHPSDHSAYGAVLAVDELAADKMLALYGRARGRDFADVHALLDRYIPGKLLELAARKDRGFSTARFVEALSALDRLPREDFPVDDAALASLRSRMKTWRHELSDLLERDRGPGLGPPGLSP